MFNGDKKRAAGFCLDQFERLLQGLRRWDCDIVSHAEVHSASLFLCEDDDFAAILKRHYAARTPAADAPNVDSVVDAIPEVIDCFFIALVEYMEAYNGKIC